MDNKNNVCVNCSNKNNVNCTNNRLVTESCGHVKCIECLLKEKNGCQACNDQKTIKNIDSLESDEQRTNVMDTEESQIQNHDVQVDENTLDNIEPIDEFMEKEKETTKEKEDSTKERVHDIDWSEKKPYKPDVTHIKVDRDNAGTKLYFCMKCKKMFRTLSNVKYHLYCNGSKPYKCNECSKEYAIKTHYRYHKRMHRGERPHACDTCGATFLYNSKLQRHLLMHSDERKYKCKQCSKGFTSGTALRRHNLLHSGEQPFKCSNCSRRFRDASNYKKHLLRCHDETKCLCGMCAARSGCARAHQCTRCPLSFHSGKDLKRHTQIHTDSKPFRCKVCDSRFRRKDNLERHIRNKHPNHSSATAAECDVTALQARQNVTISTNSSPLQTETSKPEVSTDKTQLEQLNPLPPMPEDVTQLYDHKTNNSKDRQVQNTVHKDSQVHNTVHKEKETVNKPDLESGPEINKRYIIEANIARQSVIVAKKQTEQRSVHLNTETYVHKIKKSILTNQKDVNLPPIDTKKLCQFYKEVEENNLDIGDPRPESVQKFKTILMVDGKNSNGEKGREKKEEDRQPPIHWRRKMTLNMNW